MDDFHPYEVKITFVQDDRPFVEIQIPVRVGVRIFSGHLRLTGFTSDTPTYKDSEDERAELERLQDEMLAYRRKVAPLPLEDLRQLKREMGGYRNVQPPYCDCVTGPCGQLWYGVCDRCNRPPRPRERT